MHTSWECSSNQCYCLNDKPHNVPVTMLSRESVVNATNIANKNDLDFVLWVGCVFFVFLMFSSIYKRGTHAQALARRGGGKRGGEWEDERAVLGGGASVEGREVGCGGGGQLIASELNSFDKVRMRISTTGLSF